NVPQLLGLSRALAHRRHQVARAADDLLRGRRVGGARSYRSFHPLLPISRRQRAALRRVGEAFYRDAGIAVFAGLHAAQIEILHRVVRLRERELAARAVDLGLLHRRDQLLARRGVSLDRGEASDQQLPRVVALHGIDIDLAAGRLLESGAEGLVPGVV